MNTQTEKRLLKVVKELHDFGDGWMPTTHNYLKEALYDISQINIGEQGRMLSNVSLYYTTEKNTWSVSVDHRIPGIPNTSPLEVRAWYEPWSITMASGLSDEYVNDLIDELTLVYRLLQKYKPQVRAHFGNRIEEERAKLQEQIERIQNQLSTMTGATEEA